MSVASVKARSKSRCQRGAPTRASGTWPLRARKSGSDSPLGDSKPLQLSAGLAGVRPRASDPAGTGPFEATPAWDCHTGSGPRVSPDD